MTRYDVIIAGAGPAGSSLAIQLGRMGRSVLLLDRSEFPREKACGEGIMPSGVAALRRLSLDVPGLPFHGVRYHHAGRTVCGRFPQGDGLSIRRSVLDTLLVDAARRQPNVDVRTGIGVDEPIARDGAITGVVAADEEYQACLVVAADGLHSPIRRKLGWGVASPPRRLGVRRHYRASSAAEPWVDAHLSEAGETYITHLPHQEVCVSVLGDHRNLLRAFEDLEPIGAPMGASPLTVRPLRRYAPGCVLLGDAAGGCDPIIGVGVTQALLSAELLAKHLARRFSSDHATLRAFDRERERLLASQRNLAAGILALTSFPRLLSPALSTLEHVPPLFSTLLSIAGGPVT